jgi:hypothetical protein
MVTDPGPDQKPAARNRKPAARNQVPAAPDQKPAAPGERRPVAMTPYAIAVALFAAFVVGGILAKAVPLWLVAVIGLAIGAAVFVFVDRYPRLPGAGSAPPRRSWAGRRGVPATRCLKFPVIGPGDGPCSDWPFPSGRHQG